MKLSRQLFIGSILENGLGDNFRSYAISWAFQNRTFHFFANSSATKWGKWGKWGKKSKLFKFEVVHSKYFRKRFCSYLQVETECLFWTFENAIFQTFANFSAAKLKLYSGKMRQSLQNFFSQNLVGRTFSGNGFQATLSSKTNVLSV